MNRGKTPRGGDVGGRDNVWDVLSYKPDEDAATEKGNSIIGRDDFGGLNDRSISLKSIRLPPIKKQRGLGDGKLLGGEGGYQSETRRDKSTEKPYSNSVKFPSIGRPDTVINELKDKIREMEMNMIDLKSGFERKLNQILEEIPNRLTRELKSIEERDTYQWRDTKTKIKTQEGIVHNLKSNIEKSISGLTNKLDSLYNHVESQKFKAIDSVPSKDLSNLNEVLDNETKKRQADHEENQKLFYQLQQNIHSLENEFLQRLKEHRDYQLEMYKSTEDERTMYNKLKDEKDDGDVEYLKNYIRTVERKLEDESAFRLKNEDDLRSWFEQKVASIHQKLKNEEKMALDREKKMMEQLQESLITINDIISGTKEQNLISISRSQTLLTDNMSNLTETVESVKEALTVRMDEVEHEITENRTKLNDIQVSTYKHAQTVNDTLDKEINRFEKVIGAFEKLIYSQTNEIKETITENETKIGKWKVSFEDLQTKKLLEIHSVMKQLSKNLNKAKDDTKEKLEFTAKQLTDVKSKVDNDDEQLENRVFVMVTK